MARELKYSTHHTDFEALQRELSSAPEDDADEQHDEEDDYDTYRRR